MVKQILSTWGGLVSSDVLLDEHPQGRSGLPAGLQRAGQHPGEKGTAHRSVEHPTSHQVHLDFTTTDCAQQTRWVDPRRNSEQMPHHPPLWEEVWKADHVLFQAHF